MKVVRRYAHLVPAHLLKGVGSAPRRRDVVELRAVAQRLHHGDGVHEVGHGVHVGDGWQVQRRKPLLARLRDIGGQHGKAVGIVEHARVVEVRLARPPDHRHAHLLVRRQHDTAALHVVQAVQRVEPGNDVGFRERRHVGAHGQHRVGTALERLRERMVVVLVKARALVGDERDRARPRACLVVQVAHDPDVRRRRCGDDQLVHVAHALGFGPLGRTRLEVGKRRTADLRHIEQHAVVQRRGHLGREHAVLERCQASFHQSRRWRFAEQDQRVLAFPQISPPCSLRRPCRSARPPRTAPQRCACVQLLSAKRYRAISTGRLVPFSTLWLTLPMYSLRPTRPRLPMTTIS